MDNELKFNAAEATESASLVRVLANERGMALILTVSMLVIMTVLGLLAMTSSRTELGIAGNYRALQESFFAADRAVNYAGSNPVIYTGTGVVNLYDTATHRNNIQIGRSGLDPNAAINAATSLGAGPPPMGSLSDATMFEARYLLVEVTGAFPTDITNPSRTVVETQVARIVPK
jgi:PilX N-terminal